MSRLRSRARLTSQRGLTLVELLAAITILGVISFALTESIIVGLRTTDGTAANISGSIGTQSAASYFSGDAQSADEVSNGWTGCPGTADPGGVFLHMGWTDQDDLGATTTRSVNYAFDPPSPTATEMQLIRWSCDGISGAASSRNLGLFTRKVDDPLPVSVTCDGVPCPVTPAAPDQITMTIKSHPTHPANDITVTRRAP